MLTAELRRLHARVAALTRHSPDSPELEVARQDYRAFRLEAHLRDVVEQAPTLTPEQRHRMVALLRPVLFPAGDTTR